MSRLRFVLVLAAAAVAVDVVVINWRLKKPRITMSPTSNWIGLPTSVAAWASVWQLLVAKARKWRFVVFPPLTLLRVLGCLIFV